MLDLKPEDLAVVRRPLDRFAPDAEVSAYGSAVSGRSHEGGDLDLVVRNLRNPQRTAARLYELREAF